MLLAFALVAVTPASVFVRPSAPATPTPDGAISFDPCFLVGQVGWLVRLAALSWTVTFLPLLVQGLRNRTLPKTFGILSLIAFVPIVIHGFWRVQNCETNAGVAFSVVQVVTVVVMSLHHIVPRPVNVDRRPK